jgi:hypothetical protein
MSAPSTDAYSGLSDADLKRIAAENPPADPRERSALVEEINRRAGHVRATFAKPLEPQKVVVTDIDMPFGSMVSFMVKWAIASIPAFIILLIIGFICAAVLAAFGASLRP